MNFSSSAPEVEEEYNTFMYGLSVRVDGMYRLSVLPL